MAANVTTTVHSRAPLFDRQDLIVTVLSLGVFLAAGLLFYLDIRQASIGSGARRLGSITRHEGLVQRRASDRALWEGTSGEAPVFEREWIRTGERGSATIELGSAGGIVLESYSMITLYVRENSPELDLSEGTLSTNGNGDLRIRTAQGKSIRVRGRARLMRRGAKIAVQAQANGVEIIDGQGSKAVPHGSTYETTAVAPSQDSKDSKPLSEAPTAVALQTTGSAATAHTPAGKSIFGSPRLLFPAPNSTVDMTVRESLPLRWSAVPEATGYVVHLRRDGRTLITRNVTSNTLTITDLGLLDVGLFTWEVTAHRRIEGKQESSPSAGGSFRIILRSGPERPELEPSSGKTP